MTNRHYAETFDEEMTGVHKARRDAQLEEEEWLKIEAEERAWEMQLKKGEVGVLRRSRNLKEALIKLRDEILISLRLKKREPTVEDKIINGLEKFAKGLGGFPIVPMSPEIVEGCKKSLEDIKAGRVRSAQQFIDELDQGESDG